MDYSVDVPNPYDIEGPWTNLTVGTRKEALAYVKKAFGADEQGNINLITGMEGEEDHDNR